MSLSLSLVQVFLGNRLPVLATDPEGDVRQFITQFEGEYGSVHPPFLDCSYGNVNYTLSLS